MGQRIEAAPPEPAAPVKRRRILVAEDDEEMRAVLLDALRRDGHEVRGVENGAALLIELSRPGSFHFDSVDLILSDLRMPVCSGLRAVETLRSVGLSVPVILLTAFATAELRRTARAFGVLPLGKPISIRSLRKIVSGLADRRLVVH